MNANVNEIEINGTAYVPKNNQPTGDRYIVVLDRGWIGVGHLTEENGECRITNCKNLRRWERNGFGGVCLDPVAAGAELDDCADIIYQRSAEILRVPIGEEWGRE